MATKVKLDAVEASLDVAEAQLDNLVVGNNKFVTWVKRGPTAVVLISGVAFCAGAGISYLVTNKKLKTKYEELAEQELAEAKKYYSVLHKKDEFSDPTSTLEQYEGKVENLNYVAAHPALEQVIDDGSLEAAELIERGKALTEVLEKSDALVETLEETTEEVKNVFEDTKPNNKFNLEEEMKHRTEDAPYVINHDEFYVGEPDYQQSTLTYYDEDDVLTDERDQPINDTDGTVGDLNLTRFGHGSKDNKIVYIRSDRLGLDFEVVRSSGSYVKEVLGFVEHSDKRGKTRRFRGDDE